MADRDGSPRVGHGRHDPLRVAEAVDRGGRLAPVLQFCDPCGQLYADLVALTSSLSFGALPPRPRDYTLGAAEARRLRPGGWRASWSWLGAARDTVVRPLAIGFTTLGLAGLLLTAAPALLPTMASSGAAPDVERVVAASADPGAFVPLTTGVDPSAPPEDVQVDGNIRPDAPWTLTISLGLVAVGGGMFAVRRITHHSRRVR